MAAEHSFTLLRGGSVFAPENLGVCDVLLFGERILAVAPNIDPPAGVVSTDVIDLDGALLVPGLIDGHCHPTGAGGVSGPETRSPELPLSSLLHAGITTVVGVLGGDGVTRQPLELLARVRALAVEGLSAYMLVGAYRVPPPTITGDIQCDVYLIPECLGVGEIAVNDSRSSQPTLEELARIVADAHAGGRLAGKRGITNIHMGTGRTGLGLLRSLVDRTDIPIDLIVPTHLNRTASLLEEAVAWGLSGGCVDLTTSIEGHLPGVVPVATSVSTLLAGGVGHERITLSTDAGGVYPLTDERGCRRLHRWSSDSLLAALRATHHEAGLGLSVALMMATTNVARNYGLSTKGRIAPGFDADLIVLESNFERVSHAWARGRHAISEGVAQLRGTFEPS